MNRVRIENKELTDHSQNIGLVNSSGKKYILIRDHFDKLFYLDEEQKVINPSTADFEQLLKELIAVKMEVYSFYDKGVLMKWLFNF